MKPHLLLVVAIICGNALAQNTDAPMPSRPSASTSAPTPVNLTPTQLSAIITVSGSGGCGTAFVCSINGRSVIITNQHVIAGNPDATFKTQSGAAIPIKAVLAANDADLAMLEPQSIPPNITPLEFLSNPEQAAKKDDATCIPGNSKGDGVITQTFGRIIAIGPQKVEPDNPVYHGNSGGPIIHLETGKVIGVLTEAELIKFGEFEKASFRSKQSAIKSEIRYFGYRVDNVAQWQPLVWADLQKLDAEIKKSKQELRWISDYFTDASSSYKEFEELHKVWNGAVAIINEKRRSVQDKISAYQNFLRDIDYLIRRSQSRLTYGRPVFLHKKEIENINLMATGLRGGVGIAKRDNELTKVLVERGGY
jgi:hypothetical protein